MKTKKFYLAALTVMCSMTMTTMFTACGDDDDDKIDSIIEQNKKVSIDLDLSMPLSEDMLKYCDIVVTYNDGTGEKTETPTTQNWEKTLSSKLPASFSFARTVRMKSDVDPDAIESFTICYGFIPTGKVYTASGGIVKMPETGGGSSSVSLKGSAAALVINEGKLDFNVAYAFDANGNRLN